jgi:uncharacterized protein (DUF1697 family)
MADLRALACELGLERPRTLLQSGNLVGEASAAAAPEFAARLSEMLADRLGVRSKVVWRGASTLFAAIDANPFGDAARDDPARLHLVFLDAPGDTAGAAALAAAGAAGERVALTGADLYVHFAGGAGNSRLTSSLIDRRMKATGTARNWNTVLALAALARG